ncbi:MAG: hydrogenase small subunit [Acidobacteria bacterium]|nr:hydrogenase small subunit [Acidobacteriota bacterium]
MNTFAGSIRSRGVTRRDFMKFASVMTAALALPVRYTGRIARALASAARPTVIWLEFQDCAGDSESFLRSSHPTAGQAVLDLIDLAYHETIMAPAGAAAEKNLRDAMERARGKYIVIVEGSIPTAAGGAYCTIGGRSAVQILEEVASGAAALIAVGTCASFGGLPAAAPNPTGAMGVRDLVKNKPVLNLPGCSVNGVNLAATITHYLTFSELPATDQLGRPLFAYGQRIHDTCPRRSHFDAGRFVKEWGDAGHRQGWCLYQMGCKGPKAMHNCAAVGWNDGTSWPIEAGHPCIACTEPGFWDGSTPFYRWMGESLLPTPHRPARPQGSLGIGLGAGAAAAAAAAGTAVLIRQRKAGAARPDSGAGDPGSEGE